MRGISSALFEAVSQDAWRGTPWVESFTDTYIDACRNARCVVDVGAGCGFYSFLAQRYGGRTCSILAIEPDAARCAAICAAVGTGTAIRVMQCAVSDTSTRIVLSRPNDRSPTMADIEGQRFDVRAEPLDALLEGLRPDIVKIDVEGAEALALAGMTRLLARREAIIFLECHPWMNDIAAQSAARIEAVASDHGYSLWWINDGRCVPADRVAGRLVMRPVHGGPNP
jgi:FkbM family methyltransferase